MSDSSSLPSFLKNYIEERRGEHAAIGMGGAQLDGRYRLEAIVGDGGFGVVYRAQDTRLTRTVAVKVLRTRHSTAAEPSEALRSVLQEARTPARLAHPGILTVYDAALIGRVEDGDTAATGLPYIVSEWVDGTQIGTQQPSCPAEPVSWPRWLGPLAEAAEALAFAHDNDVIHRDLKPANIKVDREGRVRVLDFGLAHTMRQLTRETSGTPGYMAPEQWDGHPQDHRVDIFALAVIAYELLTGRRPFQEDRAPQAQSPATRLRKLVPSIPLPLDAMIERALRFDPSKRLENIDELARAFRTVHAADGQSDLRPTGQHTPKHNPYPGLRSFSEDEASRFFGRDPELASACDQLSTSGRRWLSVEGPSGIGKSSFVRAGVIPLMQSGTLGPCRGQLLVLRPGRDGLNSLDNLPSSVGIVVIDQLEELLAEAPKTSGGPIEALPARLEALLTRPESPWLLTTLRSDWIGSLAAVPGMAEVLNRRAQRFELGPMDPAAFRQAIEGPAQLHGRPLPPDTSAGFQADAAKGCSLPLIAYALRQLWDVTHGDCGVKTYRAMGGAVGALAASAEAALESLSNAARADSETLMLELIRVEAGGRPTRRAVPRSQLRRAVSPKSWPAIMRAFGGESGRGVPLLSFHHRGEEQWVELAHERLCSDWPTLQVWIAGRQRQLVLREELERIATSWHEQGRPDDSLLRGSQLARLTDAWRPSARAANFVDTSRRALARAADRQRIRRWRVATTAALAIAVVSGLATWVAFERVARARDQQRADQIERLARAVATQLVAGSQTEAGPDGPDLRPVLAASSIRLLETVATEGAQIDLVEALLRRISLAREHGDDVLAKDVARQAVALAHKVAETQPGPRTAVLMGRVVTAAFWPWNQTHPRRVRTWIEHAERILESQATLHPRNDKLQAARRVQLVNLARLHRTHGTIQARRGVHRRGLALLRSADWSRDATSDWLLHLEGMAQTSSLMGLHNEAEAYAAQVRELLPEQDGSVGRRTVWARHLRSHGDFAQRAGRWRLADERYHAALALFRRNVAQTGGLQVHRRQVVAMLVRLGDLYLDESKPDKARDYVREAVDTQWQLHIEHGETNDRLLSYTSSVLRMEGRLAVQRGRQAEAEASFRQALAFAHSALQRSTSPRWPGVGRVVLPMASLYISQGRHWEAEQLLAAVEPAARLHVLADPNDQNARAHWMRLRLVLRF